jgi:hypothetical protein
MHCGQANRFCAVLIVLASFFNSGFAAHCPFATSRLGGIGDEYAFSSANKLSVLGFSATVTYASLPAGKCSICAHALTSLHPYSLLALVEYAGTSPFLKIIGASEQPSVETVDGVLTISTESCDNPTFAPTEAPSEDPTSSAITFLPVGIMASFLAPRWSSLIFALSFAGSLTGAYGQGDTCMPSIEIEISMPDAAIATTSFGMTDHYLAATVETVRWGYFDSTAPFTTTMASGETVTVEVITHHSGHDYAKMIRGDDAVAEIFYWANNTSLEEKPVPKLAGTGVHLITGPIEVTGAEPGDVVEVQILELDPRKNPATGKTYGTNSQKFAGYQYNSLTGFKRDETPYVRTGGTEAITVFEFVETDSGEMAYGKPVYMYRFPNMTAPDGSIRKFDNNPSVTIPQEFNMGYDGAMFDEGAAVSYPEGFDSTFVSAG